MTGVRTKLLRILATLTLLCMAARAEITIEVAMTENGDGMGFFLDCARAYEKAHPGVVVNLHGDARIGDKLRVRILEGNFPDVIAADLNFWTLIRSGDIQPMDEFLDQPNWEGDNTWRGSFLSGTLDRYSFEGKVYGTPLSYYAMGMWYNKGMFEEHGWRAPKTVDELVDLCEKIKAAGIAPIAFQGRYPGYAGIMSDPIYYQLAGSKRFYDMKNLVPGSFKNPELETAFSTVQRIATNYFQEGCMGMSHTEAQMQFFLSNTAIIPCGAWLKSEMMGKIPDGFRLGYFNFPAVKNPVGNPADTVVATSYFFVMKKSQHPKEGADFLRFMTSRKMSGLFCTQRNIPVATKGGNEGNSSPDMTDLIAVVNASTRSYGEAPGEGYPDMIQKWNDVWEPLVTGKATPAYLCQKLENDAAAIRARAADPNHITIYPENAFNTKLFLWAIVAVIVLGLVSIIRSYRETRRSPSRMSAGRTRLGWKWVLLFVGPAALLYTVFVIVPSIRTFPWSLNQWDGLTAMQPVGFLNYKRLLLENKGFWIALTNNLFIMIVIPLFVIPLSLFFAVCISRGMRGSRFFRVAFFFPNIIGGVAAALLWMHMYNPKGGPLHVIFSGCGKGFVWLGVHLHGASSFIGHGFSWLGQLVDDLPVRLCHWIGHGLLWFGGNLPEFLGNLGLWFQQPWLSADHLYWALVPMSIWAACGFNMILFLAAMESISPDIYEAAEIDGASPVRQFWTITIPLIWEVLSIAIVFMVIGGMKTFEVIWLLTNQVPSTDNHVIGTCMVQAMFKEYKVGESAAIAVLMFVMVFFGTIATMRAMKRQAVEM